MKISVVMAVYNGRKYLREQLESIKNQSCSVDELIICDDCSTDSCVDVVESFKKRCNFQIRYVENDVNAGYAQTFFKALFLSTGDLVFISDQDDVWEKNKVSSIFSFMKKHDDALCVSSLYTVINDMGTEQWREKNIAGLFDKISLDELIKQTRLRPGMSLAVSRWLIQELEKWNTQYYKEHDRLIELVACLNDGFYLINKHLIKYRIHSANVSGSGVNLTFRLRSDKYGRIKQIDKEMKYLENLMHEEGIKKSCGLATCLEIYLGYYAKRRELLCSGIFKYLLNMVKYAKYCSSPRIIVGDLISMIMDFKY